MDTNWIKTLETVENKTDKDQSVSDVWAEFDKNGVDTGPYNSEIDTNIYTQFNRAVGTLSVSRKMETFERIQLQPKLQIKQKTLFKNNQKKKENFCAFCKNNHASPIIYMGHTTKACPRLNEYVCPTCNATGHTIRYCPQKKIITPEDLAGMK